MTDNANMEQLDVVGKMAAVLEPTRSIVYQTIGKQALQLHIFAPAGLTTGDRRPCFFAIHGGGWTGMEPRRMYPFAKHFADLGMVGICVQYRLCNLDAGATVFDCVRDTRTAMRYLRSHATELGIDSEQVIAFGGSAGGHLAMATVFCDGVANPTDDLSISTIPAALVLIFPVIDTSSAGYGAELIGEKWRELSPLHNVRPDMPPTIIFHGTGDTMTPFTGASAFHAAMHAVGNRCELEVNNGGEHGYLMRDEALLNEMLRQTEVFLTSLKLLPVYHRLISLPINGTHLR